MPVVSQSMTRPMVPVGAITDTCALRNPGALPSASACGVRDEVALRAGLVIERHRRGRNLLVAGALAIGGAAVIANDAQHVLAVLLVAREGPELLRHLGRGRVGHAGEDRGERAGE